MIHKPEEAISSEQRERVKQSQTIPAFSMFVVYDDGWTIERTHQMDIMVSAILTHYSYLT